MGNRPITKGEILAHIAFNNAIGYLTQILPCAALCFLPFTARLRAEPRRVYTIVGIAILLTGIPYTVFAAMPLPDALDPWRITIQNVILLALIGVLVAIYAHQVDASRAQKAFVILLVMNYGYFVTQTSDMVAASLFPEAAELPYMYPTPMLLSLICFNAAAFAAMVPLARYIRTLLRKLDDDRMWWRASVLPGVLFAIMMLVNWIPGTVIYYVNTTPETVLYYSLEIALGFFALFLFWWILRIAETVSDDTAQRTLLMSALKRHVEGRAQLEQQLEAARERVDELERVLRIDEAPREDPDVSWMGEVVTLGGPRSAVSFLAGDLCYAESLKRSRILHLVDGATLTTDVTLAEVFDHLPQGHFAYCHRSVVINLNRVTSIDATQLVLDDGTVQPVSRRRLTELRALIAEAKRG